MVVLEKKDRSVKNLWRSRVKLAPKPKWKGEVVKILKTMYFNCKDPEYQTMDNINLKYIVIDDGEEDQKDNIKED